MSTDTVCVGCKVPNGLILYIHRAEDEYEPVYGDPTGAKRLVKKFHREGEPVRIFGPAIPKGQTASYPIRGGYALTTGVNKDFMDRWLDENAENPLVKNQMVLVQPVINNLLSEANEKKAVRSGNEPLNPENDEKGRPVDPRIKALSRPKASIVSGVEKYSKKD